MPLERIFMKTPAFSKQVLTAALKAGYLLPYDKCSHIGPFTQVK